MSSRKKILEAIFMNKPVLSALPVMPEKSYTRKEDGSIEFEKMLKSIGGTLKRISSLEPIRLHLAEARQGEGYIVNTIFEIGEINKEINRNTNVLFLEPIQIAYIQTTLGVAENGAVWLDEADMYNRLLPFICQHLVILLRQDSIVGTMHDAYRNIKIDQHGFGVFLAGPSKTADIEQSLVIGAHGARSLCVYLFCEN